MKSNSSSLLASALLLSLSSLSAQASLTSYSVNGEQVVYDDLANITWLEDDNLLDTLFNNLGRDNVIQAIKAASPSITDATGIIHTIVNKDFNSELSGATSWYGAKAFIGYLNSIHYAGSNQWALPSAGTTFSTGETAGYGDESEHGDDDHSDDHSDDDSHSRTYWQDTELSTALNQAWQFDSANGYQDTEAKKTRKSFVWAITAGNLVTVPLPGAAWLLLSGLIGFLGLKRFGESAR